MAGQGSGRNFNLSYAPGRAEIFIFIWVGPKLQPCEPGLKSSPLQTIRGDYIKDRVFATPVSDVEDLKAWIQVVLYSVTENMLNT